MLMLSRVEIQEWHHGSNRFKVTNDVLFSEGGHGLLEIKLYEAT